MVKNTYLVNFPLYIWIHYDTLLKKQQKEEISWLANQSLIMDISTGGQKQAQTQNITNEYCVERLFIYIARFLWMPMGLYRKTRRYTISMVTRMITVLKTWKSFVGSLTKRNTEEYVRRQCEVISIIFGLSQKHGTKARRGEIGIQKMHGKCIETENLLARSVLSVVSSLMILLVEKARCFVLTLVNPNTEGQPKLIILEGFVLCVKQVLPQINIGLPSLVQEAVPTPIEQRKNNKYPIHRMLISIYLRRCGVL